MNNKEGKSRFFYSDLFDEAGGCDHDEEVLLYFQRLISAEKKERFEQHLKECSICSASLLELEEMEAAPELDRVSAEEEEFFRINRKRLRESVQEEFGRRRTTSPWFARTFSFPLAVNAVMISLILLLLYPAYQFFLGKPQVSTNPELTPTVILPIKLQRSAQMETLELTFNKDQRSASIIFSLPLVDYSSFVVEISKAGKPVWQKEIHPKDSRISLILYRDYFESGDFQLTVFGLSQTSKILLSKFSLNVRIQ